MAIDASIYGQIRQPEAYNPLAELAQFQQYQGLQNQNKLAQLGFQDRERSIADAASMKQAVQQFTTDTDKNTNLLYGTGNLKAAQDYQKGVLDARKTGAETTGLQVKNQGGAFDNYKAQLQTIQDPQQAAQFVAASYRDPTIGPLLQRFGSLEDGLGRLQQAVSQPGGFEQWRATAAIGIEKLAQMAQVQNVNLGGQMVTQSVQPATGQVTQLGAAPITQSADNAASNETSRANNTASVGASYANAAATRDVAQSNRDSANIQTGFKNEQDLRKEFEGLPETKNYKQAFPAYAAVKDAAARNTPQADINLVYGIAKLYDPNSVVREGEYATVANSPNIPERVKGYAQYLAGGGKLSPETKRQIMAEAEGRMQTYQAEADKARASYTPIAQQRGIKPESVFPAMGASPAGAVQPSGLPGIDAIAAELARRQKR